MKWRESAARAALAALLPTLVVVVFGLGGSLVAGFGAGCSGSRSARHDGSGALTPPAADSVLAWQPLQAGDRATVYLRDGRRLVGVLTGGADSSLFIATAVPSVMQRGRVSVDTLDRAEIQFVGSRPAGENALATFIAFPVGIVTGFITALVIGVVLGVGQ